MQLAYAIDDERKLQGADINDLVRWHTLAQELQHMGWVATFQTMSCMRLSFVPVLCSTEWGT